MGTTEQADGGVRTSECRPLPEGSYQLLGRGWMTSQIHMRSSLTAGCILYMKKLGLGFPCGTVVKNLPANAGVIGDTGSIPGLGRSPGEGNATHYSILAWRIPRIEEPGGL